MSVFAFPRQKFIINSLVFWFSFTLFHSHIQAQSYLSTQGKAIVNEQGDTILLRGMGLGGWMLQEGYMLQTASFANAQYQIREKIEQLIGAADTDAFYEAWLANHCRKADVDSLKAWGFNSVRLPMHYNLFTLPIEDEPVAGQQTWLQKGFELTDSLISWCKQNEMYVILDLHATPGGQGYDQGISDYDPSKLSLWESQANRDKCASLWKRLAARYVNEPWVAGYDLINEPNWDLPGGTLLRQHYEQITDSIRAVDTKHMLIIEGNWFANDFTGLTPPWDANMVYSPHKYWSYNYQEDIQWVLTLRENHNVPLYLGESGENSNVWFRDAIRLLEDHQIGWAWWPMKKIEAVAGPLSITKTADYEQLLNYWNNGGPTPTATFTKNALMALTDLLKIENCFFQKDVIDAMFRQVYSDEHIPFNTQDIPGWLNASDYDMGREGVAYFDTDLATYHVSNSSYAAWNKGWAYRNDGVDVERSQDAMGNGFNVGWTADGEWMLYSVNVTQEGVYDIDVRVASATGGGNYRFGANGAFISRPLYVPSTGGWQSWQNFTLEDVVLDNSMKVLRFHIPEGGYNLSGFEFKFKGASNTIDAEYLYAETKDVHTVAVTLNKGMKSGVSGTTSDFSVLVNNRAEAITQIELSAQNDRIIELTVDHSFDPDESIRVSYTGNQIQATDGTDLTTFVRKTVQNTIPVISAIPGKVEAEDHFFQSGVDDENTFDTGGGRNLGNLDPGDYMDYYVEVDQSGFFDVAYRTAAPSEEGAVRFWLMKENGEKERLQEISFDPTGDFQTWRTTNKTIHLPRGIRHIRIEVVKPGFNLNWLEFTSLTDIDVLDQITDLQLFPNPSTGIFNLFAHHTSAGEVKLEVVDLIGKSLFQKTFFSSGKIDEKLDLTAFPKGNYILQLQWEGEVIARKLVKL